MTAAEDIAGSFDGTYHGDVRCFVPGLHVDSQQAVLGNGTNTWVECNAAIQSLSGSGALAFGAWVVSLGNNPSVGGRSVMCVNPPGSGSTANRWLLQSDWTAGVGHFFLNTPGDTQINEPGNPHALGDVVFVVANVGTGSQQLFTNGAEVASSSFAGAVIGSTDRLSIGQDFDSNTATSEHWIGPLDGAFLMNRRLTTTEVADLYAAGQAGTYEADLLGMSGLVALWPLDDIACPGFAIGHVAIGRGAGIT
jgi:hypothetical protein